MGLDITAISEVEPIEIPEGIELWSNEYYDWEADQATDRLRELLKQGGKFLAGDES